MRSTLISLMSLCLLLVGCTGTDENLEKMVPADALGVVSINLPDILKKTGINSSGKWTVPESIKPLLDENDASAMCTLITDMPYMGLDVGGKAFVFFTNKTFGTVLLASLDDEQAARKTIERRTGGEFAQVEAVNCLYSEDQLYVVQDKVLFFGTVNKAMDIKRAAQAAQGILSKQRKSIADDEQIAAIIHADNDVNVYLLRDGLKLLLSKSRAYREMAQRVPLLGIFTESDINAYVCHLKLNDDSAQLTTQILADANSDYNQLMNTILNEADASFLHAVPNSMDCIVSMSVNGENFVQLAQIQQLVKMFNKLPFIGQIDLGGIIRSIDGPFAVALARDPNLEGEWNAVVAAQTTSPDMIINQIGAFASAMGQAPEMYDNEYVYQYENKMIRIGTVERVLYLKMLDYEQTEGDAHGLTEVRNTFAASKVALYVNPQVAQGGTLVFGLTDNMHGSGRFTPNDKGTSAALALLRVLCSIKPPKAYDDMLDEGDDFMAPAGAIDQLRPVA